MAEGGPEVSVQPFRLMRHEVTVELYQRCIDDNVCTFSRPDRPHTSCNFEKSDRGLHPANCVSWQDARAFSEWFGHGARLPTEVEWAFAASSGGLNRFAWGSEADCERAIVADCGHAADTEKVCDRPAGSTPSPRAVCNLTGNVAEFVQDDWHEGYDCENVAIQDGVRPVVPLADACPSGGQLPTDGSAWQESPQSQYKVVRGGSFGSSWKDSTTRERSVSVDGIGSTFIGFRLVIPGE